MATVTAAILIIGNEVLSGRVDDANIGYIARRLNDVGIKLRECRVVADTEDAIVAAVNALRKTHTYVFTTGGIGPTHDDITTGCIAKAFGVALERNERVAEGTRSRMGSRFVEAALKSSDYPAGARVIWHGQDFPPGFLMENVAVLAGIPKHMQVMFEAVLPLLEQGDPIFNQSVDVWIGESQIAAQLGRIQERYSDIDIGSYPYRIDNRSGTALVVRGTDSGKVTAAMTAICVMLDEVGAERRGA